MRHLLYVVYRRICISSHRSHPVLYLSQIQPPISGGKWGAYMLVRAIYDTHRETGRMRLGGHPCPHRLRPSSPVSIYHIRHMRHFAYVVMSHLHIAFAICKWDNANETYAICIWDICNMRQMQMRHLICLICICVKSLHVSAGRNMRHICDRASFGRV